MSGLAAGLGYVTLMTRVLTFFYKSADGTESLFTPDRLVDICEMEKTVEVVFLGSVLRLFYGTVSPDSGEEAMAPVFEHLGLSYALLKSAFQGEEDRFVPSGNIRVRLIFSGINEIQKMAMPDFLLSFISVILVFGIAYLHTKSSIIAASSMFMMIMTLPVAALVYQGVLRVQYFEFLHILVVYLVLGIGADDIFVFKDTFCHIVKAEFPFVRGGRLSEEQEIKALSLTFQRAGVAIFNTSFTTALAFASCSVSRCMPMRTCGWYAATCIVTLYVLTLTYFPPVLLFWHRRLQAKRCCCPTLKQREFAIVPVDEKPLAEESAGPVELFFEKVYIPVMSKKVGPVRIFALILFLIMFGVAVQGISFALQLTPPRSEEVWFPGNHMFVGIQDFMAENFYTPAFDNYAVITVIFGIAGLDTSGINVYDPGAFIGTPIFDDSFDLTTSEAQTGMLDICSKLRTITCDLEGCDNSGYDTFVMQTTERTVSCFLEDFQQWLGGPLPTGANFTTQLQAFRSAADKGAALIGTYRNALRSEDIGFIDGELKYVALHFRSVMKKRLPFSIGISIENGLLKLGDCLSGALPSSLKSMKFHGNGEFQRYDMGEELINGLFSGIAIAMPISFLVLLSSTQNVVVAIYAVLSVGAIVLCVLGFCKSAMDWDLGVGEAIAGVIVIGYSVDYVVHLAHMYSEGMHFGHQTRDERAKFAIRNMGSTIFAGAITTMLAGATMFVCWFYFFIKMALLICVTIMYSFLFSLVFFMSLLWTAGQPHCTPWIEWNVHAKGPRSVGRP
ncbi:Protein dispatched homolog 1 (Protein chameleon) [Durusdinium trenchii]|uniref:Protein dispatched homolog 1 (Protein chameleon) n=1 Tax=Durusdinium trenchii TaxID=1381693 RepID=A0ABP0SPS4_9DINO